MKRCMPTGCVRCRRIAIRRKTSLFITTKCGITIFKWNSEDGIIKKDAVRTACLVGIRTQESLDRWRTIYSNNRLFTYHNLKWSRRIGYDLFNLYPIYDWRTEDIWVAYARFKWPFNQLYELYYKAGVPLDKQRVASPFLSTAQETLKFYKAIDPNTWGRMLGRVNGVNFTGIYGGTRAMGWQSIKLPKGYTWKEYMYFYC